MLKLCSRSIIVKRPLLRAIGDVLTFGLRASQCETIHSRTRRNRNATGIEARYFERLIGTISAPDRS